MKVLMEPNATLSGFRIVGFRNLVQTICTQFRLTRDFDVVSIGKSKNFDMRQGASVLQILLFVTGFLRRGWR